MYGREFGCSVTERRKRQETSSKPPGPSECLDGTVSRFDFRNSQLFVLLTLLRCAAAYRADAVFAVDRLKTFVRRDMNFFPPRVVRRVTLCKTPSGRHNTRVAFLVHVVVVVVATKCRAAGPRNDDAPHRSDVRVHVPAGDRARAGESSSRSLYAAWPY